jgi:hypothetical protein
MVAAKAEFDGVAQWSPADDFDLGSVAESHLKQAPAYFGVAAHGRDVAAAADAELIQRTGFRCTAVVATGESTSLVHNECSRRPKRHVLQRVYPVETQLQLEMILSLNDLYSPYARPGELFPLSIFGPGEQQAEVWRKWSK